MRRLKAHGGFDQGGHSSYGRSYDASGYDPDLERHFQYANSASANASASPQERQWIRNRARYECLQNNAYGVGIVQTLAQDTIGTGPRLQFHFESQELNEAAEMEFKWWAKAAHLDAKLRLMKVSKTVDGEAIAKMVTNPPLPHEVKLDLQLLEADRLSAPYASIIETNEFYDGIHFDEFGNPVAYDILRRHPGAIWNEEVLEWDTFQRSQIIHVFRHDRAEQARGVSELVSSLPLFAHLRRYTLATVLAAETAANHSVVIRTDNPVMQATESTLVDPDDPSESLVWRTIPLDRNAATVLPENSDIGQMQPEQPTTTYPDFKRQVLNEVARSVSMPYNVAAADSSGYNYASGRLDHQVYDRSIRIEQACFEHEVLDRVLGSWLVEAALVGVLPAELSSQVLELFGLYGADGVSMRLPHTWQWDRRPHVDPGKEALAQQTRLKNGTTSRELELREAGLDMDEVDESAARSFNISVEELRNAYGSSILTNGNATTTGEDEDEGEAGEDEQPSEAEEQVEESNN